MQLAKTMAALVTASLTWTMLSAAPATADGSGRNDDWHKYVLGPDRTVVRPLVVEPRGAVANAEALLDSDHGIATLSTSQGGAAASVLLDFGREIGGTPYFDVASSTPGAQLSLVTGEAKQYIRQPGATTLTAAAAAGSTQVGVRSVSGLEAGHAITFGSGPTLQQATITAVDGVGLTTSFSPALTQPLDAGAAVSSPAGGPASDESPGLAGVGGIDTLVPTAAGRLSGTFHGGFRYVLLTMTGPGTVELSGLRVRFQAYRATPSDYQGWFLSSDDLLNRLWYAGAYTNQMNMKPPGLNGLPDARIYDGAKRDRSIWTGDLLVQGPTLLSTLGGPGARLSAFVARRDARATARRRPHPRVAGLRASARARRARRSTTPTTTPATARARSSTTTATPATGLRREGAARAATGAGLQRHVPQRRTTSSSPTTGTTGRPRRPAR